MTMKNITIKGAEEQGYCGNRGKRIGQIRPPGSDMRIVKTTTWLWLAIAAPLLAMAGNAIGRAHCSTKEP